MLRLTAITIDFVLNKSINDIDNYMLLKKKAVKISWKSDGNCEKWRK